MNHFVELARLAAEFAPTFASAFLSPAAGLSLKLVESALGLENAEPGQAMELLQGNPNVSTILTGIEAKYAPLLKPLLNHKWPSCAEITIRLTWPDDKV
jgi:hypothetical protein